MDHVAFAVALECQQLRIKAALRQSFQSFTPPVTPSKKVTSIPPWLHGALNTYIKLKCRCQCCTEANSAYSKRYRARHRRVA